MSLTDYYLYFPQVKIIKAHIVPQMNQSKYVIALQMKSLINTPNHYPQSPILKGKANFYLALDITEEWKNRFSTNYNTVFECNLTQSVNKLVSQTVSVIARFSPANRIKLEAIGIGKPNKKIILYNAHFSNKEMDIISLQSQLNYKLSEVKKTTARKKI